MDQTPTADEGTPLPAPDDSSDDAPLSSDEQDCAREGAREDAEGAREDAEGAREDAEVAGEDAEVADEDTSLAEDEYAEEPAAEQPLMEEPAADQPRTDEPVPEAPRPARKPAPRKKGKRLHIEQEMGSLEMSDQVIATIVHEECRIQGGLDVRGKGLMKKLGAVFSPGRMVDGVYMEQHGRSVLLEVTVAVEYGIDIPALANEIRGRIGERIETITGCRVRAVNIIVDRILMRKQPPK